MIKSPQAEDLSRRLNELANDMTNVGQNPRGMAKLAALVTVEQVRGNFRRQVGSKGARWPRLKYRTGTPLVNKQGRMPKGITSKMTRKGFIVAAGQATKDFNAVHNFGSKVWHKSGKKKGVPQREYMYLSKDGAAKVAREAKAYVKRKLKKNG